MGITYVIHYVFNNIQNEESALLLDLEKSNEVEPNLENTGDHTPPSKAVKCTSVVLSKARKVNRLVCSFLDNTYIKQYLSLLLALCRHCREFFGYHVSYLLNYHILHIIRSWVGHLSSS